MSIDYSKVKFWSATDPRRQWDYSGNENPRIPVGLQNGVGIIKLALDDTYARTPYAARLIDNAIGFQQSYGKTLNFARDASPSPDNAANFNRAVNEWISVQLDIQAKVYSFNTSGTLVKEPLALTLVHEISHASVISNNPDPVSSSEASMNAKIYDYRGPALKGQNAIALELNLPQNEVASYQGTMVDGVTYWSNKIEKNYSYTGGQHVDVVRMGVDTADNMDHTNRTVNEDQLPDDLFFGFGGDDTLKGGAGTDFLYGGEGSDTLYGGDGNDFIYADGDYYHQSVSGNDIIYGQAGNDVILAGLGSDRVDGGIGADRIVVGGSGRIDPGPGADKVYVLLLSDASTGVGVTIDHAESSDSLFWNGYRLTGGTLTQLEGEGEIWDIYGYLSSGSSTAGAAYILEKVGDSQINLNIYLPDFQRITIVNWQAGLMGIDLKGGDQFHPIFPLPKSNLVGDGKYVGWDQWYNELTGAAKMLANPGPADVPAYPEPAQATASNESFVRSDGIWDKEAYLMSASHLGSASDLHMCLV